MTSTDAAHRLAVAVDDHERAGGFTPMLVRIALKEWREAQDAELGGRLRDLTTADVVTDSAWGEVDV